MPMCGCSSEERCTPDGHLYFVGHYTRTTMWNDPRQTSPLAVTTAPRQVRRRQIGRCA